MIAVLLWRESYTVRNINYIWQWVQFAGFWLFMLAISIFHHEFIEHVCKGAGSRSTEETGIRLEAKQDEDFASCTEFLTTWHNLLFVLAILFGSLYQYMWVSVFWAYRNELSDCEKEEEAEEGGY